MFWGLNLKSNRKYSQTTSKDFHISQASIENGESSKVYLISGNQKFLICTLDNDHCKQFVLDLNFAKGEEVCFQTVGPGNVTLSGYVFNDKSDDEDDDDEDLSDSEILKQLKKVGKKLPGGGKGEEDDEDDEEDDDDDDDEDGDSDAEEGDSDVDLDLEGLGDEEEVEDEEEDDEDDEDDSDEEVQQPKAKQPKLEQKQAKQNGVAKKAEANAATEKKSKKDKKKETKETKKEAPKGQQQKPAQTGERTITGGVKIEDVRVGNGPEAKTGKRAQVYYEGRLKSNNKVFDSLKQGNGFKFSVGRGEVIKGWDVGVVGMKVGGKRRITCPPHMAYGARGSPPAIPPNSTLVFDVELKGVN